MKKLLCIFIILFPLVSNADNKDVVYTWSYGALADTMKNMRSNCEPTSADEFLEMGNWFREKGATFSFNEIKVQCETQQHKFNDIDRTYKDKNGIVKKCEIPLPCTDNSCSEYQYTDNSGCNIFLTELVRNNNLRAKIIKNQKPGTYVTKVLLSNNDTVYKIVDVILAPNYWVDGQINTDANINEQNTKIYDISTGEIIDTGLYTWTNDMFFDVSTSNIPSGDVRGAFVNSYIRPNIDLTQEIYDLYDNNRGLVANSVQDAFNSMPHKPLDIKVIYGDKYKIEHQTNTESHANGVMFNNKIATFDFLGNMLFGMNNQEALLPNFVGRTFAQAVSIVDGMHVESYNVKHAWDVGEKLVQDNIKSRITTFQNVQTKNEQEAYNKATQEMKHIYSNAQNIKCYGNCNKIPGSDDIVICTDSNGLRLEFLFDDICN